MSFGTNTTLTNGGRAMTADRVRATPATYTKAPIWNAMGKGATGAARTADVTNVNLTTETEQRGSGTESVTTTSVLGDTYQNVGLVIATTACSTGAQSIDEAGLFDASSSGGGNMFASATFPVQTLNPSDSLQMTWKIKYSTSTN